MSKVRLSIHDLGIELRKYRPQRGRVAVLDRVDGLNHPKNVRGHDEKVAHTSGARIPVCVRGSPWNEYGGARTGLDYVRADLYS